MKGRLNLVNCHWQKLQKRNCFPFSFNLPAVELCRHSRSYSWVELASNYFGSLWKVVTPTYFHCILLLIGPWFYPEAFSFKKIVEKVLEFWAFVVSKSCKNIFLFKCCPSNIPVLGSVSRRVLEKVRHIGFRQSYFSFYKLFFARNIQNWEFCWIFSVSKFLQI